MMMAGVIHEGWGLRSAERALLNARATLRLIVLLALGIACWRLADLPFADGIAFGRYGGAPWGLALVLALFGLYHMRGLRTALERRDGLGPLWPFWTMAGLGAFINVMAELLFLTVLFEVYQARTALVLVPVRRHLPTR